MLAINEEFYSIQGEGKNVGVPMYFVRTQGCSVGCHFCDTKKSWKEDEQTTREEDIVRRALDINAEWICITGGEPLEQDLEILVDLAKKEGLCIQIETSGVHYQECLMKIDQITLSPKSLFSKTPLDDKVLEIADELKCVITKEEDISFYTKLPTRRYCSRVFQPMSNDPKIAQSIFENLPKGWRIQCQEHTVLNLR